MDTSTVLERLGLTYQELEQFCGLGTNPATIDKRMRFLSLVIEKGVTLEEIMAVLGVENLDLSFLDDAPPKLKIANSNDK